jgi:hypothetical protein
MVNEEILGGLKSALERGQSLQKAMMSLYNSGYKKEEIEEAARNLMEFKPESQLQPPIKTVPKTGKVKPAPQILAAPIKPRAFPELHTMQVPQQPPTQLAKPTQPQENKQLPIQKVSSYESPKPKEKIKGKGRSKERTIILVLIILLILLMAVLGLIFLFKQQLIDFLSSFFT